jgi:hypothetical protein
VMPNDPIPSISLGIVVPPGAAYDTSYHWRTDAGALRASVGFDTGGYSHAHVQGSPGALRELAAALVQAADLADQADAPAPAAMVGGWLADVGRPPQLPGLRGRLARPLPPG